jgi:hypothetical protein
MLTKETSQSRFLSTGCAGLSWERDLQGTHRASRLAVKSLSPCGGALGAQSLGRGQSTYCNGVATKSSGSFTPV